jgi:hypothetical protein
MTGVAFGVDRQRKLCRDSLAAAVNQPRGAFAYPIRVISASPFS